jgi:AbrB family looped-hinge helix DNA binding protein
MPFSSKVSKDWRITIPKTVRERLGLKPGDYVEFEFVEGRVVMRRADDSAPNREPGLCGRAEPAC